MKAHYLFPGQYIVCREAFQVTTILGSCVAVALYDPLKKIAGLNHYLLPRPTTASGADSLRYGSVSLPAMIEEMVSNGASRGRLQARIYGGARVLDQLNLGESIGRQNIDFAVDFLRAGKIQVLESELGGQSGRKIILNTSDFSVVHQLMSEKSQVSSAGVQSRLMTGTVRVVIVDDSASVRTVFSRVLEQSGRVQVVGVARDAYEAREVIVDKKPDVVLLDIEMPKMSGVQFLEKLMQHFPIPTIMVSSLNPDDDAAVRALEIGALEFVHKPDQFDLNTLRFFAENLVQKVIAAASSADRVRRTASPLKTATSRELSGSLSMSRSRSSSGTLQLVAVGGNGGAHAELEVLLSTLANDSPPVLVSVSVVSEQLKFFLDRWRAKCRVQLREAVDGIVPLRGIVYFAPARKHLGLEKSGDQMVMRLLDSAPVCLQRPSSEFLFDSVRRAFSKADLKSVVAVLLGGFGNDGVQGLLSLREQGAHTIAAHPEACIFSFAPQSAIEAGAADEVLSPAEITQSFMRLRSKVAV
jgi:two-component system chemotaxis response regulator CheB